MAVNRGVDVLSKSCQEVRQIFKEADFLLRVKKYCSALDSAAWKLPALGTNMLAAPVSKGRRERARG